MKNFSVIFDMDGVLVDSMQYVFDSLNIILKEHGKSLDPKDYPLYMGINTRGLQQLFKEQFNLDFNTIYLKERTTELQLELIRQHEQPPESLLSFLEELTRNKVTMGIGTSSPEIRTYSILEAINLRKYFDIIVNGDEITHHKPHPETFLKVAEKMNSKPEKCIVFEDAANGIEAALTAKMKVIGVKTKFQKQEELEKADIIIKDFKEVNLDVLRSLFL